MYCFHRNFKKHLKAKPIWINGETERVDLFSVTKLFDDAFVAKVVVKGQYACQHDDNGDQSVCSVQRTCSAHI